MKKKIVAMAMAVALLLGFMPAMKSQAAIRVNTFDVMWVEGDAAPEYPDGYWKILKCSPVGSITNHDVGSVRTECFYVMDGYYVETDSFIRERFEDSDEVIYWSVHEWCERRGKQVSDIFINNNAPYDVDAEDPCFPENDPDSADSADDVEGLDNQEDVGVSEEAAPETITKADVKSTDAGQKAPKTSDSGDYALLYLLMVVAAAGAAEIICRKYRSNKSN